MPAEDADAGRKFSEEEQSIHVVDYIKQTSLYELGLILAALVLPLRCWLLLIHYISQSCSVLLPVPTDSPLYLT